MADNNTHSLYSDLNAALDTLTRSYGATDPFGTKEAKEAASSKVDKRVTVVSASSPVIPPVVKVENITVQPNEPKVTHTDIIQSLYNQNISSEQILDDITKEHSKNINQFKQEIIQFLVSKNYTISVVSDKGVIFEKDTLSCEIKIKEKA